MKIIKIYLNNNEDKESDVLKRCAICDSTEHYDTLRSHGIETPISYFVQVTTDSSDEMRCNRCNDAISEAEEFYTQYVDILDKDFKGGFANSEVITGLDYLDELDLDEVIEDIDILDEQSKYETD